MSLELVTLAEELTMCVAAVEASLSCDYPFIRGTEGLASQYMHVQALAAVQAAMQCDPDPPCHQHFSSDCRRDPGQDKASRRLSQSSKVVSTWLRAKEKLGTSWWAGARSRSRSG